MENLISVLNTLEPGIVIFDKRYKIVHINRVVLVLFSEFSSADIFEKSLLDLHQASSSEKISRMIALLSTSKRQIPFSIKIFSRDNRVKYLLMKLIALLSYDAGETEESLCCALLYDITAFISDQTMRLLKIPVGIKNEIKLIDLRDVVFIEADNVYSRVFTTTRDYFSGLSLGTLQDRLPGKYFMRIHRSYIVNLTKITKVSKERGAVYVSLQGIDESLPVSRNRSREFLTRLGLK